MIATRALMISAIASGQGKTTVTAALARKLLRAGQRVRIFKTGADFLDPLMLARACGQPVYVLDLWMVGAEQCGRLLRLAAAEVDVVLVEGVMGLYDGTPSSADLAREFGLAVLAVVDARAMAETVGAVALGLREFGPVSLAGVVANGVAGPGHARLLADSLGETPLMAQLPLQGRFLPERHLGLVAPDEVADIDAQIDALADGMIVDAEQWEKLDRWRIPGAGDPPAPPAQPAPPDSQARPGHLPLAGRIIAIARDAAFAFIYPANVDCLLRLGATLEWFSPLADEPVPETASAIWLPGGYPELHGEVLSNAVQFQRSLKKAHESGLPILAECGGMMVVTDALLDTKDRRWPMAGLLPGVTRMHAAITAIGLQAWNTAQGELRGHTFHQSSLASPIDEAARTVRHPSQTAGECIYRHGSLTASYFHAYFDSCPEAVGALFAGAVL
jgi:cobyrinic acid a,c-diamide synthase